MPTITFTIIAILNALMLLALLGVIYIKNTSDNEVLIQNLEKYQDMLVLGLLIGVVAAIVLSAVIIL